MLRQAQAIVARALACVGGYLQASPDPLLEHALRHALTEFDRELIVILRDKPTSR